MVMREATPRVATPRIVGKTPSVTVIRVVSSTVKTRELHKLIDSVLTPGRITSKVNSIEAIFLGWVWGLTTRHKTQTF